MESIKIGVTGNIARVIDKPDRITSGTVGLPVEFTFDEVWDGLSKTAVFKGGDVQRIVEDLQSEAEVPWEVLAEPGVWLSIGVYGTNRDGSVAIPTIWVNVTPIDVGADPAGDPSTDPKLPVYQKLLNDVGDLDKLRTEDKEDLVKAINEVNSIALAGGVHTDPTLSREGRAADAKATGDELQQVKTSVDDAKQTAENAQKAADTAQEAADTAQQTAEKKLEGTDTTLSVSGKAADAKATGDRLKALEEPAAPLSIEKGGTGAQSAADALTNLGLTATADELNYMAGVTSNVQTQLGKKTPVGLVTKTIYVTSTSDSLETQIADIYANMANNTSELVSMQKADGVTVSIGGGSNWQLLISKTNANYGSIIAVQYPSSTSTYVIIKTRGLSGGTWGNWNTITSNDTVLTSANWSDFISVSSGGTTSTGMGREFDSGNILATSYTTSNTRPKLFTLTLRYGVKPIHYPITIDYRSIKAGADKNTGEVTYTVMAVGGSLSVKAKINSNDTITFTVADGFIVHICGYY